MSTRVESARSLASLATGSDRVQWNLPTAVLYEEAVRRNEAVLSAEGPLACLTGRHTGRSPNDKFTVREPSSESQIDWGKVNRPMDPAVFQTLHDDYIAALAGKELFALDCFAGADPKYRLAVRVVTEYAWANRFCRHMFLADQAAADAASPGFAVIESPSFTAAPNHPATNSDVVPARSVAKRPL